MERITQEHIGTILQPRLQDAHKGDFGKLLIMAGSLGMAGAAVLSARGALRSGAGTVTLFVPRDLFPILQTAVPEAMCKDREESIDFSSYDALVMGPGLGDYPSDGKLMGKIIRGYRGPLVIDADGINNINRFGLQDDIAKTRSKLIFTPHPGEAARLLEEERIADREVAVKALQRKYGGVSILKGSGTLITEGSTIWENTTGNPGMATGGSGDVLAGAIGALAAQGYDSLDAAKIVVFVHGLAGDIRAGEYGEMGMTAGDIAEYLPRAYKQVLKNSGGSNGNQGIKKDGQ